VAPNNEFLGHPKGLFILFFVEMWERFSYYGMRALLIYFMVKHLLFSQADASRIYGLYTGFVYLTPFFGGILADRVLGQRKSVVVGGVLMAIGHFVMAFDNLFFAALALIALGNGAFKPNISTQVGNLYPPGDSRRDRAFNIFYVGINLGAFFAPLFCGTIGEVWGWHYGFALAGVGMLVGLALYIWGQRYLAPDNLMQCRTEPQPDCGPGPLTAGTKSRIIILAVLCIFNIAFWAAFEQMGNTFALWADEDTDRHLGGWEVPATWFQSLNPFFIFLLTPAVTALWAWSSARRREPSSVAKMGWGCLLLGVAFLIMVPAAAYYEVDGTPVSMLWLVGAVLVMTVGELCLSPVGLSLVTKLAPPRLVSMLMGLWFLSQFVGNNLAGLIGAFWTQMYKPHFFLMLAVVTIVAGISIMLYLRYLKTTAAGRDLAREGII
jgi:POT family proton-dependent oligopeptide transporter